MQYDNMTREDLIAYIESIRIDRSFEILRKESALVEWTIEENTPIILLDIASMHSMNHKYGMSTVDSFIRNVTASIRITDRIAKFGGDEIVIVLDSMDDAWAYMHRVNELMRANNLYAVMCATKYHDSLLATFEKLDSIVMAEKLEQESNGEKASRDELYTCKESTIIYAE